jgi:hypothetical protein
MLVLRHRLTIAGVITATAIAVPAAAFASGPGSPSGKPTPPHAPAASASKSASAAQSQLNALAASAGISVSRLEAGLRAVKPADGNTAAGITAFAASTGVSHATAQRVVYAVFGTQVIKQPSLKGQPAPVSALAAQLGVSHSAAQRALNQLDALGRGGVDPASPAFAAIAHELGVNPARLAAALGAVKRSMAGTQSVASK